MSKSKSSERWLKEHSDDEFVARARHEGYRGRAAYKLIELDQRDQLLAAGMTVVDLGAAPGSWCQYAVRRVGAAGRVVACDLLAIDPIPQVYFVQGDFTEPSVLEQVQTVLENRPVDLVISDMAPNISGINAVDQPRSVYLAELALEFALEVLKPKGAFLTKVFQGQGIEAYTHKLKQCFSRVVRRKPKASRVRSREFYLLARQLKL